MFPDMMAWKMSGLISCALSAALVEAARKVRLVGVMRQFWPPAPYPGNAAGVNFM